MVNPSYQPLVHCSVTDWGILRFHALSVGSLTTTGMDIPTHTIHAMAFTEQTIPAMTTLLYVTSFETKLIFVQMFMTVNICITCSP